jgi:hypothetical protein
MEEMELAVQAVAAAKPLVGYWMNWMMLVFALSVLFAWKHKAARWVIAAFVLTIPFALFIFGRSGEVDMIGLAHIIVWSPLAYYLIQKEIRTKKFKAKSCYGVWLILLVATILISLVFDVRDVAMVLMG